MKHARRYLPAASLDLLLPVYDPIMKLLGFRRALQPLLDQAGLAAGHVVLDVGCGTGTLAIWIRQQHPDVSLDAVDPDPKAIARAQGKARRAGVDVRFARAFGDALPYPDATFDRVFSSMMLHHVPRAEKLPFLQDVRRVLKPAGRLELMDFAGGTRSLLAHVVHGRHASAVADGRLLSRMQEAGFTRARRVGTQGTVAGAIAYYQACK
jgi:ubiquinone/menaquinone biosynthesis C-methylase UbiE